MDSGTVVIPHDPYNMNGSSVSQMIRKRLVCLPAASCMCGWRQCLVLLYWMVVTKLGWLDAS